MSAQNWRVHDRLWRELHFNKGVSIDGQINCQCLGQRWVIGNKKLKLQYQYRLTDENKTKSVTRFRDTEPLKERFDATFNFFG